MKISGENRIELFRHYYEVLCELCADTADPEVWPGEVLNTRHKDQAIARVRELLVERMRETVGKMVAAPRTGYTHQLKIFSDNLPDGMPHPWKPLGHLTLKRLIGLDALSRASTVRAQDGEVTSSLSARRRVHGAARSYRADL